MKRREMIRQVLPGMGGILSGLLLAAGYAPVSWANGIWFSLVPLLVSLRFVDRQAGGLVGYAAGVTFWLASLIWLTRVTYVGTVLLAMYCALFLLPVVITAHAWMARFGTRRLIPNLGLMCGLTAVWCGSEFVRSTFLTGFPWNPLGATQYRNIALLTHTTWGGVYAISGLIVWVNTGLALTLLRYLRPEDRQLRRPHLELTVSIAALLAAFVLGLQGFHRAEAAATGTEMRAALIQPNIPQDEKWTKEKIDFIYQRLEHLTDSAVAYTRPDLAIWPETAVPEDVRFSDQAYALVNRLSRLGSPLLVGTMDAIWDDEGKPYYFNSSMLFGTNGQWLAQYDKRHLVLLGEYVPWGDDTPFLRVMSPIAASFTPGATSTVFRLEQPGVWFGVLICFEDTMASLGRETVRNGARLLINQTNDAWFDPLAASRQHLIHSVLRAAENRVPVLRAANSGVSCAIDRFGRIQDVLADDAGGVRIHGFQITSVQVPPADMPLTWYTRHGDLFAGVCLVLGLPIFGWALVYRRRSFAG